MVMQTSAAIDQDCSSLDVERGHLVVLSQSAQPSITHYTVSARFALSNFEESHCLRTSQTKPIFSKMAMRSAVIFDDFLFSFNSFH